MKEILERIAKEGVEVHVMFMPASRINYRPEPQWSCFLKWAKDGDEVKVSRTSGDLETATMSAVRAFDDLANGGLGRALLAAPEKQESDTTEHPF